MRKALVVTALVLAVVALTAAMPSNVSAHYGYGPGWGYSGYYAYPSYGYYGYGGCGCGGYGHGGHGFGLGGFGGFGIPRFSGSAGFGGFPMFGGGGYSY